MQTTFTSESVCSGHPDKLSDQISDAIVDEVLRQDPFGRAGVECLVGINRVILVGEVGGKANVDYRKVASDQIQRLGYTDQRFNFTYNSSIDCYIHEQSEEIAVGVENSGAGDQGMMFGYACEETLQLMPLPIMVAHALVRKIDTVREEKILPYLRPDGKSQVTVEYKNGQPAKVSHVVVAVPHSESVKLNQVKNDVFKNVVQPILNLFGFKIQIEDLVVNGTGVWHKGGPASDAGLTGRKIAVDTYGSYARIGGGCFSGKDPTKVDRSGAYAARFLAKNIVAQNLAKRCEVRLAYFIGAQKPTMQEVETFGTAKKSEVVIKDFMGKILDTSVAGILTALSLRRPIYLPTAAYGHFGREEFPWERVI